MNKLCEAFDKTFWPRSKWPDFASMPNKDKVVVIVPIVGLSDWDLNLSLDLEEVISMPVLEQASREIDTAISHLVLPPLRFVIGSDESTFFTVDSETAHQTLKEITLSIQESGFRKVVFYNSSPWNEDLLIVAARDFRIELGMQMFCINLAGIGLDLLSDRSTTRDDCRILGSNEPADKAKMIMEASSGKLAGLLKEVADRPLLANGGIISQQKGDAA